MHMHIHIHTDVHIYIYMYVYIYICMYVCMYVYKYYNYRACISNVQSQLLIWNFNTLGMYISFNKRDIEAVKTWSVFEYKGCL